MALLNEELTCSICLNIYKDPVMLNCGHHFCQECIEQALDTPNGSGIYTCPECRTQFPQRPPLLRNRTLCNIIQCLQEDSQEKLRNALLDLTRKSEATKKRVESLHEQRNKIQENSVVLEKAMNVFFETIVKDIKICQKTVLREISRKRGHALRQVSKLIKELEIRKLELSRKIQETQKVIHVADPETILREEPEMDDGYHRGDNAEVHLDEKPISLALKRSLSSVNNMISEFIRLNPGPDTSDILLDVKTACNYICISPDCRSASFTSVDQGYPEGPERFKLHQVLSICSFSAQQYWEVDVSKAKEWTVGVAYQSMDRKALVDEAYIGYNNKSWCLAYRHCLSAIHNKVLKKVTVKSPVELLGVYVDYDCGLLSFYKLSGHVKHLYSFRATFTERLHAAFYVFPDSCVTTQKREHWMC